MKKLILSVLGIGVLNFAQATSITLISGNANGSVQMTGQDAYLYLIQITLAAGQTISSASVDFNSVELISTDAKDTVSAALITQTLPTQPYTDNDDSGNYFLNSPFNGTLIGKAKQFTAPQFNYSTWQWVYDTETWSVSLSAAQLTAINTAGGTFDIGIDPDCIYPVLGSIQFSYNITSNAGDPSVPDQGMTAGLLGMGFLGLLAFRRKLAFN